MASVWLHPKRLAGFQGHIRTPYIRRASNLVKRYNIANMGADGPVLVELRRETIYMSLYQLCIWMWLNYVFATLGPSRGSRQFEQTGRNATTTHDIVTGHSEYIFDATPLVKSTHYLVYAGVPVRGFN